MNIPCNKVADCYPCYESPIENLSVEAEDTLRFACIRFAGPPPLNITGPNGCITVYYSEVSQEDACLGAERQVLTCPPTCINPGCDGSGGGGGDDPTVFLNAPQTCASVCPDGTVFTFTTPAGTFGGTNQADADEKAYSYACQKANEERLCLSPMERCFCHDEAITQVITATGNSRELSWSIVSGTLPPWLTIIDIGGMSMQFVGTATTSGDWTFYLKATDAAGNYAVKEYSVTVVEITTTSLPDFEIGVPYDVTLVATGGSGNYAWRIVSGTLPTGLVLELDGQLHGTPTSSTTATLVFDVIDTTCEETDESFFPPRVAMDTVSTTRIATILGFQEYYPTSTPPKKYKKLTWTGYSQQRAKLWDGSAWVAGAKYVWSGSSEINSAGQFISLYTKNFYAQCPTETQWPIVNSIPNYGLGVLKGYCWTGDPDSCDSCPEPYPDYSLIPLVGNVAANTNYDGTDFLNDQNSGTHTITPTTLVNQSSSVAVISIQAIDGFPSFEVNGEDGNWLIVDSEHDYSATLSDEYTDAEALANAKVFISNGSIAATNSRTTGFVSTYVDVAYTMNFTNLVVGKEYVATVTLRTDLWVSTVRSYTFTAVATTYSLSDTVPTPSNGHTIQVFNPQVRYA